MKRRIFLWGETQKPKPESSLTGNGCVGCGKSDPAKWGPLMWQELHVRAVSPIHFTGTDICADWREHETRWLSTNYVQRIPCQECREHLVEHLSHHPLPQDWMEYQDWAIEFHNVVNAKLGKPRWRERNPEWVKSDAPVIMHNLGVKLK